MFFCVWKQLLLLRYVHVHILIKQSSSEYIRLRSLAVNLTLSESLC